MILNDPYPGFMVTPFFTLNISEMVRSFNGILTLFTPRPRAREFQRSVFYTTYDCGATVATVRVAQFSDFGLFPPYKTPKTVPSGDQLTAQRLHRRMIPIFPCDSRKSKGVPSGSGVFIRHLVGELGTPNFPKFSPMANGYTHTEYGASDLDQRCLKTRNSKDGRTFPPNIFVPTPKISPKTPFWRHFNAKPIIERALRKSHVNGVQSGGGA